MAATRRKDQKAATRAKVIAAARVCFETLGYERATVRDIARTAGMSTGAVLFNFASKAAVYTEVFGHAPISPELGRALLLAGRVALNEPGPAAEQMAAALAGIEGA